MSTKLKVGNRVYNHVYGACVIECTNATGCISGYGEAGRAARVSVKNNYKLYPGCIHSKNMSETSHLVIHEGGVCSTDYCSQMAHFELISTGAFYSVLKEILKSSKEGRNFK